MIERVDLGVCPAYEYLGDGPTAIVLPGAMLAGMPAVSFAYEPLLERGWRVIHVWDEFLDRSQDPWDFVRARAEAAAAHAGDVSLVIGKSLGVHAARVAAERDWPAVWLTPILVDGETRAAIRARSAPALLVGGTADGSWDGALARELSDDVLELEGADHGLARTEHAQRIADAVAAFV